MKKIIPFKKDIIFKTNLSEITSISLENSLHIETDNFITGTFTVSGDYKITDTSVNVEEFSYDLPFDISMDDKYILNKANVDINDFYYEIINDNVLSVNIEVVIDKLEEKLIKEPIIEENQEKEEFIMEEKTFEREDILNKIEEPIEEKRCNEEEKVASLFDNMDETNESYQSYKIYIVREGDSIETIMEKYSITKEEIEDYNDLKEFKIGAKIIIPTHA